MMEGICSKVRSLSQEISVCQCSAYDVSAMGASGFGWNEETQTVAAAKEVWTEYLALTLELHIITCFVVYLKECIRIKL